MPFVLRPTVAPPSALTALSLSLVLLAGLSAPVAGAAESAADYPPEHAETRELLELVGDAVALVEEKGVDAACSELSAPDSRWFHGETYVFVNDTEGRSLCHPAKPALEGTSVLDLRDPYGKPVVRNFMREVADDGRGWVHYLWPRPGEGTNFHWKTSYVRTATPPSGDEVIVGSGRYQMPMEKMFVVEQVNDAVALLEAEGADAFPTLRDKAGGFRFYDSYLFVMDEEGVQHVNAAFPEREGQDMLDFVDENGTVVGREMLDLLKEKDSGWVDYMWPRPGDDPASPKLAYVRRAELPDGSTLVVGAGLYGD